MGGVQVAIVIPALLIVGLVGLKGVARGAVGTNVKAAVVLANVEIAVVDGLVIVLALLFLLTLLLLLAADPFIHRHVFLLRGPGPGLPLAAEGRLGPGLFYGGADRVSRRASRTPPRALSCHSAASSRWRLHRARPGSGFWSHSPA